MPSPTTLGGVGMAAIGSFPVGGSTDPLKAGIFLFLDGVNIISSMQAGTLELSDELGVTKHLEFQNKNLAGGSHLSPGQRLILRQETVNLFLGTIDRIEEILVSGNVALFTRVEVVDLNAIPERRLVTVEKIYSNTLAGNIVKDLVQTYLTGEPITTNSVQGGPTITTFTIEAFSSVSKALRELSDLTGFIWFIDANGDLHFEAQAGAVAPFGIADRTTLALAAPNAGVWKIAITNNGILQTILSPGLLTQTILLRAPNATVWELKVTNDGLLQTVSSSGGSIGGFLLVSADGSVWGLTVTNDGVLQTEEKIMGGPGLLIPLDGISVGTSRERYRNRQTVRYGTDLALSVTVDDTAEQNARKAIEGGTGIYHAAEDVSEITTSGEATAFAQGKLRRFGKIPKKVTFGLRSRGLQAGQTIPLSLQKHDVFGDFLIDQLSLRDEGAQILRWDVTALSGEHLADTMGFWRKALAEETSV